MKYTAIEKRFLLAAIIQLHKSVSDEKLKAVYADSFVRVSEDHPSADMFVKVLAEKALELVDKTLSSPVISEESRVRAQTIKDAFLGIKEKLSVISSK